MRRDHVNQQWRTLRLPRNIHSVSWPICFLVILALYPIVADIILQDMGKSYNYFTFFKIFLSSFDSISSIIKTRVIICFITSFKIQVIFGLNCFVYIYMCVICILQFRNDMSVRLTTSLSF